MALLLILASINVIAFIAFGWDKRLAETHQRRIPERTLLALALFGGALGALIGWPLVRERNRNTPLLLVLFLLWSCNAAFHVALWRDDPALARRALLAGINLALILVTGAIEPNFLTWRNLVNVLRQNAVVGIVACGVLNVINDYSNLFHGNLILPIGDV